MKKGIFDFNRIIKYITHFLGNIGDILYDICKVKRLRTYLALLLLVVCGRLAGRTPAAGQERMWNAALDRYEYVYRRCADWRERIGQGKPVPKDSLRMLSKELSEVRKNLQYALGDMTPGQRRRFESIRDWFTTGEWPEQVPGRITPEGDTLDFGLRTPLSIPERFRVKPGMTEKELGMTDGALSMTEGALSMTEGALSSRGIADGALSSRGITDAERISPQKSGTNLPKTPVRIGGLAGITVGVYPDLSYGILAGITIGKWCLFVKGRTNFHAQRTSYICLSDGTIPAESTLPGSATSGSSGGSTGSSLGDATDSNSGGATGGNSGDATSGGYFWSGGEQRINRHQITLDASYAFCKPVSLYLGVGYGVRTLCWKDFEGEWARVRDRSYKNVALDAGLLIHPIQKGPAKGLTFLIGGSWIPRNYFDAEVGLAWRF